ncbi:MAG: hypothetical protein RL701_2049 [Pseudomonadota bacterium]|jgi:hypothetical protein
MPSSVSKKPVPVYLRGIPSDVVREAKAIAARRGITLASFVAETLARAVSAGSERGPTASVDADIDEDGIAREMRWYERNREQLARQYGGEFVAIVENRVVDHDEEFEPLAERMFASYGSRSIFMPLMPPASVSEHASSQAADSRRPLRLRSPRIAKRA